MELIKNGQRRFTANNADFGDNVPYVIKTLTIFYRVTMPDGTTFEEFATSREDN